MLDVANLCLLTEKSRLVILLRAATTKRPSVLREGNAVQGASSRYMTRISEPPL